MSVIRPGDLVRFASIGPAQTFIYLGCTDAREAILSRIERPLETFAIPAQWEHTFYAWGVIKRCYLDVTDIDTTTPDVSGLEVISRFADAFEDGDLPEVEPLDRQPEP